MPACVAGQRAKAAAVPRKPRARAARPAAPGPPGGRPARSHQAPRRPPPSLELLPKFLPKRPSIAPAAAEKPAMARPGGGHCCEETHPRGQPARPQDTDEPPKRPPRYQACSHRAARQVKPSRTPPPGAQPGETRGATPRRKAYGIPLTYPDSHHGSAMNAIRCPVAETPAEVSNVSEHKHCDHACLGRSSIFIICVVTDPVRGTAKGVPRATGFILIIPAPCCSSR